MSTPFNTTPVRLTDKRFLEGHEFTLDSDTVKTVDVYGRYFLVRSAAEEFEMKIPGGNFFKISQGEGFDLGDEDRFTKLHFRRVPGSTVSQDVKIRTSDCYMFDARLSIVRGRFAAIMQAPTVWTAHSATIAAGAALDLTAAHPTFPDYLRKATIVTNMDPAVDLEILNSADATLDTVLFRTTKLYEVSEGIKVKNNTGAPVVCRASQAWYVVDPAA